MRRQLRGARLGLSLGFVALLLLTSALSCQSSAPAVTSIAKSQLFDGVIPDDYAHYSFDPGAEAQPYGVEVDNLVFDGLVTLDQRLNVELWGASRVGVSPDGLTYTFHLRTNQAFSDGAPVHASDYAYSINRALDPCRASPAADHLFAIKDAQSFDHELCRNGAVLPGPVQTGPLITTLIGDSVVADDNAGTLAVTLAQPSGYFLSALAYPAASAIEAGVYGVSAPPTQWARTLAMGATGQGGSGMYYIQSVTTPEVGRTRIALKANPYWWGLRAGRHPHLTEIDWTYYSDVDTAYSQYAAGLYTVGYPTPTMLASARTQRDFHQALTLDSMGVFMGWDQPPLDNPDARIALCLAIDRDALNQSAFGGARMPTWHLVPQGMPGYNGDLTGPDGVTNIHGDAARAQAHWQAYLRTLGGAPPASMGLPYLLGSAAQDAEAHALQQQWQTVLGVYVVLVGYSSSPPRTTPNLGQPLALADWSLDYPDPQDILSGLLDPTSPYNVEHINYPAAATLVQQADMSADAVQRVAMYNQAEQLYINQVAWCPLAQSAVRYQVRSWVRGWTLDAAGIPANDAWIATYLVAH